MAICSFLSRDWWEDSRRQCWSFECQGERSTKAIERQTQGLKPAHATIQTLEYCPDCRVAAYCSKECRKKDCKTGHKKRCNRPPLVSQAPGSDELMLCFDTLPHLQQNQLPNFLTSRSNAPVLVQESTAITDTDGAEESSLGDANDDDSWETLSSGDADANGSQSKTTKIYQFFKEKTYSVSS
jgi:hypothetical protein